MFMKQSSFNHMMLSNFNQIRSPNTIKFNIPIPTQPRKTKRLSRVNLVRFRRTSTRFHEGFALCFNVLLCSGKGICNDDSLGNKHNFCSTKVRQKSENLTKIKRHKLRDISAFFHPPKIPGYPSLQNGKKGPIDSSKFAS